MTQPRKMDLSTLAALCAECVFETKESLEAYAVAWAGKTLTPKLFEGYELLSEAQVICKLKNWDNMASNFHLFTNYKIKDWSRYQTFYCIQNNTYGTIYLQPYI